MEQDTIGARAEADESKIEVEILKKRRRDDIDELKFQLRLSEDKAAINEGKSKNLAKEFERLQLKFNEEIKRVGTREKELESQLELVTIDSSNQVVTRDEVILKLKRKIDSLEFNMESIAIKEQLARDDKNKLEEKLDKIVRTLRGSMKILEEDMEWDIELLNEIKKS